LIAKKYYFKILEARQLLTNEFGCEKYMLLAEKSVGIIFSNMLDS
jgi:hypothetical protein